MLKLIRQFITENATRLSDQLTSLEANVDSETRDIRSSTIALPAAVTLTPKAGSTVTVSAGQVATADTTTGNVAVTLERPRARGYFWLVKSVAANSVVVTPAGLSAPGVTTRINGASSKTYTAVGLAVIYFDGFNWWAN